VPSALPPAKQAAEVPLVATAKPPKASASRVDPAARSQAGPVGVEALYEKACFYHRHQRLQEAINMYREVLKRAPGHFDAAFNLTSAYLQTQSFDQAYTIAADLNLRAPGDARILLNLAVAEIGRGRPRPALDLLDRSAGLPRAPLYEIYFHKGIAFRQIGETDQSLLWYRKAEAIKADDPDLLFNLAVVLDVTGSYGTAADYYQRYLQIAVDGDAATRARIARRIRDLRADLAAHPGKDESKR
jgi:Flp pilus assembly protein TadD